MKLKEKLISNLKLIDIYVQLCRHRVSYIEANISDIDATDENKTFVKDIEVTENE